MKFVCLINLHLKIRVTNILKAYTRVYLEQILLNICSCGQMDKALDF